VEKALTHNVYSQLYTDLPMIQICDSPTHGSPMKHIVDILQYVKPKKGDWVKGTWIPVLRRRISFVGCCSFLCRGRNLNCRIVIKGWLVQVFNGLVLELKWLQEEVLRTMLLEK